MTPSLGFFQHGSKNLPFQALTVVKVKLRDAAFEFLTRFPLPLCEFGGFSRAPTAAAASQKFKYIPNKTIVTLCPFFGAQSSDTKAGVQETQIPGNSN